MAASKTSTDVDAIVVGAGFGGIYMLHKLRNELGLTVRAFDRASGVGGTWHWNRYPGALSDTEGFVYCYSFDKDLLQQWTWDTRYLTQSQVLAYLEHVVERFDLGRDIQLNTGITSAVFDESRNAWEVRTDTGETFTARYLVSALGLLSATNIPDIAGRDTFEGEVYHTGAWPEEHDLAGKRVGVLGTGSTGCQVITALAPEVGHLTVFQRSAQYSVPIANGPVTEDYVASVKANYDQVWDGVRNSVVAFGFKESAVAAMSVSEEERQRVFEKAWERGGGFHFMFGTFSDIATDPEANEAAASFIRAKIAEIVEDPETARKLTPTDLYAKRPLCDPGYYETFNRDNVSLVDVKANPIAEITPKGVRTEDGQEHQLDVLIFATGFDAVDGNYTRIDIRGRGGRSVKEHWKDGPTSYLGISTTGFPNLFMILGPNGPFTNLPPSIEAQGEWISELINNAERSGVTSIEATAQAEEGWTTTCREIANMTLFPKADSWIFGANIPGKPNTVMFYMAGLQAYRQQLAEVTSNGYAGFEMAPSAQVS
ncbi:MAG: SidA/IucD/PvdA family monooxygenase [Streptosporangiales bacterium]|nr:SidA/IucD/PvdA family monooxygenase [Streptosporangiales bacterium]